MRWKNTAPPPSDAAIERFERQHGVSLPAEHRWFLQNVANGGRPVGDYTVPTVDCPGGAASLHGVYGIDREEAYYDLGSQLDPSSPTPGRMPFGYDDVGGELFLGAGGKMVYNPRDPDEWYASADSISRFLESLTKWDDSDEG